QAFQPRSRHQKLLRYNVTAPAGDLRHAARELEQKQSKWNRINSQLSRRKNLEQASCESFALVKQVAARRHDFRTCAKLIVISLSTSPPIKQREPPGIEISVSDPPSVLSMRAPSSSRPHCFAVLVWCSEQSR